MSISSDSSIVIVIPARYASTRFPAKVLADIDGKPMIQRVFEQAQKTIETGKIIDIFVATDHPLVFDTVKSFTKNVLMTEENHLSGTDRIAEASLKIEDILKEREQHFDFIINVQGDEPFIEPKQIELLADVLINSNHNQKKEVQIATLVSKIKDTETLFDSNQVKAVFDTNKKAIYFSRHPVPFLRNYKKENWLSHQDFYKHIGMYAYEKDILQEITNLSPSTLELAESLEQLRWLENGYTVQVEISPYESIGIDTPEDLEKILNAD